MNGTTGNDTRCATVDCQENATANIEQSFCITLQIVLSRDKTAPLVSKVLAIALNSLTAVFATITNTLIIAALVKKRGLRNAANLILTSMAFSDLMVGISVQPLTVTYIAYDILNLDSCAVKSITAYFGSFCVAASFMNTCFFALDRCFATLLPYLYIDESIYKKYAFVVVIGWTFLTLLVILTYAKLVVEIVLLNVLTGLFFISLTLICVSYIIIYNAVKAQRRKIESLAPLRRTRYAKEDFITNSRSDESQKSTRRPMMQ